MAEELVDGVQTSWMGVGGTHSFGITVPRKTITWIGDQARALLQEIATDIVEEDYPEISGGGDSIDIDHNDACVFCRAVRYYRPTDPQYKPIEHYPGCMTLRAREILLSEATLAKAEGRVVGDT